MPESSLNALITVVMFQAGHDPVRVGNRGSLKSTHAGGGVQRAKPWVFAKPLGDAAPARIARQIHHWRERPVNARRRRLARGNGLRPLEQFGFPRTRLRKWNRENGAKTVNDI